MQESNAKLFSMPYSSVYKNHFDHVRVDCLPGNGGYLPASFDTRDFNGIANFDDTSDFGNKYPDVLFVWLPSRTHSQDPRKIPRMAPWPKGKTISTAATRLQALSHDTWSRRCPATGGLHEHH
jgi:hypothetical protein